MLRIIAEMGSWPVGVVLLFTVVGPWLMAFFLARGQERRFAAVQTMYENNVKLVEGYEKLCQRQDNREGGVKGTDFAEYPSGNQADPMQLKLPAASCKPSSICIIVSNCSLTGRKLWGNAVSGCSGGP